MLLAPPPAPVEGICPGKTLVVEYEPADYAVLFQPPLLELGGVAPRSSHDDGVCRNPGAGAIDRSALRVVRHDGVSLVCRTTLPYGIRLEPPAHGRPARITAFRALGRAIVDAVVGRRGSAIRWDPRVCRRDES